MDIKEIIPYIILIGAFLGLARYFYTILGSVKKELYVHIEKREKEIRKTLEHERKTLCIKIQANKELFDGHLHDEQGRIIQGRR